MTALNSARWRRAQCSRLAGVVAVVLASVASLNAAAPRLILISGPLLEQPVLIQEWDDTFRVMAGINDRAPAALEIPTDRPYYDLGLFWGMEWVQYVNDGRPLTALKPEHANQHARFYPAVGSARALVVFADERGEWGQVARRMGLVRSVDQMALDVFTRYRLRVRMDPTDRGPQ
jgi:hypothetical protein